MTTFKASSRYRHVFDYVPFAKPLPAPRPAGWRGPSTFEKSLHRWVWCNRRIAALAAHAEAYALVRSEDIFSGEAARRNAAMSRVFDVLQLEPPAGVDSEEFGERVNPAPLGPICAMLPWSALSAARRRRTSAMISRRSALALALSAVFIALVFWLPTSAPSTSPPSAR